MPAVIFDLWGTLIHDSPALEGPRRQQRLSSFVEAAGKRGIELSLPEVEAGFRRHLQEHALMHARGEDLATPARFAHCLDTIRPGLGAVPGLVQDIDRAFAEAIIAMPPQLDPEAAPLISALKDGGHIVGLLSNTAMSGGPTLRRLDGLRDLLPLFNATVFSDEVEMAKPSPAIFRLTLSLAGAQAKDAAFVGDNPIMDIAGAQAAGIYAVQIGRSAQDGVTPDASITALSELPAVLERWQQGRSWT